VITSIGKEHIRASSSAIADVKWNLKIEQVEDAAVVQKKTRTGDMSATGDAP
jgi:hypothetical protein